MTHPDGGSYDPETVKLLWGVLDEAWDWLSPDQQARTQKVDIALRVLLFALRGERNPVKLWMGAVTEIIAGQHHRRGR
jgi:hypothetical protein